MGMRSRWGGGGRGRGLGRRGGRDEPRVCGGGGAGRMGAGVVEISRECGVEAVRDGWAQEWRCVRMVQRCG